MPALALEVHRVEHLLAHLPPGDGTGDLEEAVGQGDLPWSMWAMMEKLRMRACCMRATPAGGRRGSQR